MSSMDHKPLPFFALLAIPVLAIATPACAQDPEGWDQARQNMAAKAPTRSAQAIARWESLIANSRMGFDDYAGFISSNPGFPKQDLLQTRAENALGDAAISPERLVAFFDRFPPLSNPARARYALALQTLNRPEAVTIARQAWRGGKMSSPSAAYLEGLFASHFTQADNDARMDALLWQNEEEAARRQIALVTPAKQNLYMARLAYVKRQEPSSVGLPVPPEAANDAGYLYNRVSHLRASGQSGSAVAVLASRPPFAELPFDSETLLIEMLKLARTGNARQAQQIAAKADDLFEPNVDIRTKSYRIRDDYTSLMWLGGTESLWKIGDAASAAPLFYRYGAAAQTPQTRSKGFYWAGLAAAKAGDMGAANRYYEMAAAYPNRFYGMLALDKLGRPMPNLNGMPQISVPNDARAKFQSSPLAQAVREVSRNAPWRTGIQFYRAVAQQATTQEEHQLVAELAREVGRRDLAVNLLDAAGSSDIRGFTEFGYPTVQTPPGTNWTMVHAIARQESQFAQNAVSHAGARGLMQLMPGTAREQAGKLGMTYMSASLIDSPSYNIQLGDSYFDRMLNYYNGSYPLAVAAYNAGPGNVNKWLRANGDPRTGSIDWVTWGERIPIYETKNYVQRILENAVVYEHLYPQKTRSGTPRPLRSYLQ